MAFGAMLAAILAVLGAAGEPAEPFPGEPAALDEADEAAEADAGRPAEEALAPAGAAAADPAEPAVPLGVAPAGRALADSGAVLLDRIERASGWARERLLEPSGEIVEHEVNRAGTVQSCRAVGSLFALRVIDQRRAASGEFVHVVRDASGALLRFAVGADGEPRAVALLAPPPR